MHYLGAKTKLISFIKATISDVVGEPIGQKIFCDLFAGSGVVSLAFKDEVASLITNDAEYYSYILTRNMLRSKPLDGLDEAVETLLTCKDIKGRIYQHYAKGGGEGRTYFSDDNAQKIDALRQGIEAYKEDEALYVCLLASLLESAHKVSNTTSIYSAFLKELKPLAREALVFEPIVYTATQTPHTLFCEDANDLIEKIEGDILYLDPPYNRRQYGANYHLLNTIARYDAVIPFGKTGMRAYESSAYCKARTALNALEELVCKAKFKTLFLSYNNEGLLSEESIAAMMKKYGHYTVFTQEHQRFKAHDKRGKNPKTVEFLHVLEKNEERAR